MTSGGFVQGMRSGVGEALPGVLVVGATEVEVAPLIRALDGLEVQTAGPYRLRVGRIGWAFVGVVVTGVGKANAAMGTALALGTFRAEFVLGLGVAGAYPESGLGVGEVAVASEERYADEGVEVLGGFLDLEKTGLSFGLPGGNEVFGAWNTDPSVTAGLARAGGGLQVGSFVTVSTVTGTDDRARILAARTGALCESMEGAAVAQAAAAHGVRFAEIRGVSNPVGRRDRGAWRVLEAAEAACVATLAWLSSGEAP